MQKALDYLRKIFAGGILGAAVVLMFTNNSVEDIFDIVTYRDAFESSFCIFLIVSPILYILFLIIGAILAHKKGFVGESKNKKKRLGIPLAMIKLLGLDIISPFMTIFNLIGGTLLGKIKDGQKGIAKSRIIFLMNFILMAVLLCFIGYGVFRLEMYWY